MIRIVRIMFVHSTIILLCFVPYLIDVISAFHQSVVPYTSSGSSSSSICCWPRKSLFSTTTTTTNLDLYPNQYLTTTTTTTTTKGRHNLFLNPTESKRISSKQNMKRSVRYVNSSLRRSYLDNNSNNNNNDVEYANEEEQVLLNDSISNKVKDDEEEDEDDWVVGDYQSDFQKLRQAIMLSEADNEYKYQQRKRLLDYFANQRQPITNLLSTKYISKNIVLVTPIVVVAVLLSFLSPLLLLLLKRPTTERILLLIHKNVCKISMTNYWITTIILPISFFCIVRYNKRSQLLSQLQRINENHDGITTNSKSDKNHHNNIDDEYDDEEDNFRSSIGLYHSNIGTTSDRNNSKKHDRVQLDQSSTTISSSSSSSCNDYIMCLLEQWISVICGYVIVSCISFFFLPYRYSHVMNYHPTTTIRTLSSSSLIPICTIMTQILVRIGISASVRQYIPLWYQLNQPCSTTNQPIQFKVWFTKDILLKIQNVSLWNTIDLFTVLVHYVLYKLPTVLLLSSSSTITSSSSSSITAAASAAVSSSLSMITYQQYYIKLIKFYSICGISLLSLRILSNKNRINNSITYLLKKNSSIQYLFEIYHNNQQTIHRTIQIGLWTIGTFFVYNNNNNNKCTILWKKKWYDSIQYCFYAIQTLSIQQFLIHYYTIFQVCYVPTILRMTFIGTVLIGPIGHILGFLKLIRIAYTNGLSLPTTTMNVQQVYKHYFPAIEDESITIVSNDDDSHNHLVDDEDQNNNNTTTATTTTTTTTDDTSTYQWRYWLHWRTPERIHVTISKWWNRCCSPSTLLYWLMFSGSVDEKIAIESKKRFRYSEIEQRRLTIWQRLVDDDIATNKNSTATSTTNEQPFLFLDYTKWKSNAMKQLAQKHQLDYDLKTIEDPLGVAIQQTFGIGLGYNFDHMTKLTKGQVPSVRRLQARAAKSALYRARQLLLLSTSNASVGAVTKNDNNDEHVRKKSTNDIMKQQQQLEIEYIKQQLMTLVPSASGTSSRRSKNHRGHYTNDDFVEPTTIEQYYYDNGSSSRSRSYEKVATNEYITRKSYPTTSRRRTKHSSPVIQSLLSELEHNNTKQFITEEVDNMDPLLDLTKVDEDYYYYKHDDTITATDNRTEEEFIEDWIRQQQRQNIKKKKKNKTTRPLGFDSINTTNNEGTSSWIDTSEDETYLV